MRAMAGEKVHRELALRSPMTEGPDVKALQQALNRVARQFPKIVNFELVEDGQLGERTLQATVKGAHVMGLIRRAIDRIEKEHLIAEGAQRMLRNPGTRSDAQKRRAKQRQEALRKKLQRRPSLSRVRVTPTAGAQHWGGSNDVMTEFVEPFMVKRGLPLGSGKRTPAHNASIGGSKNSDHLTTKTRTAARDFPTFSGEDDARALARAMGFGSWQPNSFTSFSASAGGRSFRVQILWGAGIQHGDHVHVGISAG
jgi:hypothetical protein